MIKLLMLSGALLACACSGDDSAADAGGTDGGTSATPNCEGVQPLELGRCLTATGVDCTGSPGDDGHFAPIGGAMTLVVGPQGYTMLVMAMRAMGIDPGAAMDQRPTLEVIVVDESDARRQVALYRERKRFVEDAEMPGSFVNAEQLWVVTATQVSFDLDGHRLHAVATLRDRNDMSRCGQATFDVHRQ